MKGQKRESNKGKVKILFLGVGSPLSQRYYNVSIVINDFILLDAPPGVDKKIMEYGLQLANIDYVFITHFHGDHILGLPQFLLNMRMIERNKSLYVIGPEGIEGIVKSLLKLTFKGEEEDIIEKSKTVFISVSKEIEQKKIANLTFEAYKLSHGREVDYGYLIYQNDKKIGYTGDTGPCENLEMLIEKSNIIILDMTFEKTTKSHLGIDYAKIKSNKYKDKLFFGIHRGKEIDNITLEDIKGVIFPSDGDIYEF